MSVIKRFGVFSVAKIFAAISLVIGLILGILALLLGGIMTMFVPEAATFVGVGIVGIIIMAIGAAISGFIYGAIAAFIYNLAAGWFGGVEIELE